MGHRNFETAQAKWACHVPGKIVDRMRRVPGNEGKMLQQGLAKNNTMRTNSEKKNKFKIVWGSA